MEKPIPTSPVSFEISANRLPRRGMPVVFDATEKQRAALAEIHDLVSVESFRAELLVSEWKRSGVRVEGRVAASITQACVVTLEPITNAIDEEFVAVYLPKDSKLGREGFGSGGEIMIDVEGPDSPELFDGDRLDIGALAEEHFGLAIDPYPRKTGAVLAAAIGGDQVPEPQPDEWRTLGSLFPKHE